MQTIAADREHRGSSASKKLGTCRLHIKIARALEWGRHEKVGQARLGDLVAVQQHAALATLLIVDDEIQGEARPTGPTRVRRLVGMPMSLRGSRA